MSSFPYWICFGFQFHSSYSIHSLFFTFFYLSCEFKVKSIYLKLCELPKITTLRVNCDTLLDIKSKSLTLSPPGRDIETVQTTCTSAEDKRIPLPIESLPLLEALLVNPFTNHTPPGPLRCEKQKLSRDSSLKIISILFRHVMICLLALGVLWGHAKTSHDHSIN